MSDVVTAHGNEAPVDNSNARPTEMQTGAAQGVNLEAAAEAFRKEIAKDAKAAKKVDAVKAEASQSAEAATNTVTTADAQTDAPAEETGDRAAPAEDAVEVPERAALKAKLRSQAAARVRAAEQKLADAARKEAEAVAKLEAAQRTEAEIKARAEQNARLEELKRTNPREWLKESGLSLRELVTAELAEKSPEARSQQMAMTLENLPKIIEQEVQKRLSAQIAENQKRIADEQQKINQQRATYESEQKFIESVKAAKDLPATQRIAAVDPRAAVHMAYFVRHVFKEEHGRYPNPRELEKNVERLFTMGAGKGDDAEETASNVTPIRGRTSPRSNSKERSPKPIEAMSEEERLEAAAREFRREMAKGGDK